MSLDISKALSDGFSRTFERNGLLLMVGFVLLGAIDAVAGQTSVAAGTRFLRRQLETLPTGQGPGPGNPFAGPGGLPGAEQTPLALPVPLPVALGLVAVVAVLAEWVRIVGVRTLVSNETTTVPEEFLTRRALMATLNGVVGGIVVLILVVVGLLFLVVPGVFLALSFFFVRQEIAVEDRNFVDALSESWELTSGHRIELFALALVIVVIGFVVGLIGTGVGLAGIPLLTTAVNTVVGAVTTVFGIAVAARAYVQLKYPEGDEFGDDDVGAVADDGDEWDVQV
ncbi:hypothetical protein [Salinigranum sp. GCM10025319]|uniref:hypothetical protein n=1 Tax=Salinigranum sp. GCM10025319 TaxID=3252687 RepID=UPI00360C9DBA